MARLSSVKTLIAVSVALKWPLFYMDVKNSFLNDELSKEVYMKLSLSYSNPQGSLTECVNYGGHFMVLNKLLEHGLQSSVLLSLSIVFQAVLLIQLFFETV